MKVTEETPKSTPEKTVTDALGRKIVIKRPTLLNRANFLLVLGEASDNKAYMNMFGFVNWVYSIDGEKILPLNNKLDVDALIQTLSDEGYAAILKGLNELLEASDEKSEDAVADVKK